MPNHRNTGLLGIIQNYNDTMSQLDAQREGGLEALLNERNRLAVRDAQLDAAEHLAALREQQERAERRAHQEYRRQEKERERIAALPKCTDCESPVEGTPNRCPRCNEIGIVASSQFHAAPQLRQWLSDPARWPVLHSLGITTDDINRLTLEAASLIATLRTTPAYKAALGNRHPIDFHGFIERGASKIDSLESSIQEATKKTTPRLVREHLDAHPHRDTRILGHLVASAAVSFSSLAIPGAPGLSLLGFVSGGIGALIATIAWCGRLWDHNETIVREYKSKIDTEVSALQGKKALLMAEWPGACFRLRELTSDALQKSQLNDSMRAQWLRLCEDCNCDLPHHMTISNAGPSPIANHLAQFFQLFQPDTSPPQKKGPAAARSTVTEGDTVTVVNILATSLIAVAIADGRIQADELTTITSALIDIGTEETLARSAVKQCIAELRAGTSPQDFIKSALSASSSFKGTPFGLNILNLQRTVAEIDGSVSTNEHRVLDAFHRALG